MIGVGVLALASAALVATRWAGDEVTDRSTTTAAPSTATEPGPAPPRVLDDVASSPSAADLAGLSFKDVTAAAGLDPSPSPVRRLGDDGMSGGIAVADVFGSGRGDIYVTRRDRTNTLYRNNGDGTFSDVTALAGVAGDDPGNGSGPAVFGDFSATGCPDLYVTGAGRGRDRFYVNDCDGTFTEATAERGLVLPDHPSSDGALQEHGLTVADFDRDGDLDLLVLQWDTAALADMTAIVDDATGEVGKNICGLARRRRAQDRDQAATPRNRSRLFRNDGTGHFSDVTAELGLRLDGVAAFTGQFADVTGDAWDDLLVTGDGCTSRVFRNDGGEGFSDITEWAGVGTDENGMGSVVADVDGDSDPDWFVTSIGYPTVDGRCRWGGQYTGCSGNRLYLNVGDGRFEDATDEFGLRSGWWGWGAAIEDFSGSGRRDVVMTNGYDPPNSDDNDESRRFFDVFRADPVRYWAMTAEGARDIAPSIGLDDRRVGHGLVSFDYDGDGALDLLIASGSEGIRLYRNERLSGRHWLTVRLSDPSNPGNRSGDGARVVVRSRAGRSTTGWITTSGSYESQRLPEFHVGFGEDDSPASVDVWWPGARSPQIIQRPESDGVLIVARDSGSG